MYRANAHVSFFGLGLGFGFTSRSVVGVLMEAILPSRVSAKAWRSALLAEGRTDADVFEPVLVILEPRINKHACSYCRMYALDISDRIAIRRLAISMHLKIL